mgnify:FL=1
MQIRELSHGVPVDKSLSVSPQPVQPAKQRKTSLESRPEPAIPHTITLPEAAGKANLRTTIAYSTSSEYRRKKLEAAGKTVLSRRQFNCA